MPVDYQQVYRKIREIGAGAQQRAQVLQQNQAKARQLLADYASNLDHLQSRAEAGRKIDSKLRCAVPVTEPVDFSGRLPDTVPAATLIAADGSQIIPDRHAAALFCVVNVGAVVMKLHSGQAPEICVETELFYDDELEREKLTNEGAVSLRRDLNERKFVEKLSQGMEGPLINLTDGTIEIWGAKDIEDPEAYKRSVEAYLGVLSRMHERGVPTAGYVDRPAASLVVRLLEMIEPFPENMGKLQDHHPLKGVTDLWLFGYKNKDFQLLKPGQRSAVFQLRSGSDELYKGSLSLHFFYLNVSDSEKYPQIARVEIPQWVALSPDLLNSLHAVLIQQCRIMSSKPYPYILHRAHETAVVKHQEKEYIEQMLQQDTWRNNMVPGESSNKAAGKASSNRR
jgi:hypothetical protein